MLYIFYFPIDYIHGIPSSSKFHKTSVNTEDIIIIPKDQSFIDLIFMKTNLHKMFKYLSFEYYIYWKEISNNVFMGKSKIIVNYKDKQLSYFHSPTYNEVYTDIYIHYKIKINNKEEGNIIKESRLEGNYIIDIS